MAENQAVGLSLEEQAQALAVICHQSEVCTSDFFKYDCPKGISGLDMHFGKDCLCYSVSENDWLEYLKNRQIPVDNHAK